MGFAAVPDRPFVSPDDLRAQFSRAMSRMYREEVPAYGALVELVERVNRGHLERNPVIATSLAGIEALDRVTEERHGAIRLGTAAELSFMRRLFAVMGMFPVSYYDLSVAGIPVHATGFRPTSEASLRKNPFRVFTSLLRLDLVGDEALRRDAASVLAERDIFTPQMRRLVEKAEAEGGLREPDASTFVRDALGIFRWHDRAKVSRELYDRLYRAHALIADVVSFNGPHINHLTPRTLDIELVQRLMPGIGITPKDTIEGPPPRTCPILLRQTSFKALEEPISFQSSDGRWTQGAHTARFGEIEQRGIALTPAGRALYDQLLAEAKTKSRGKPPHRADQILLDVFASFPDDYAILRERKLAYFQYALTGAGQRAAEDGGMSGTLDDFLRLGLIATHPITYEDFLPVSAAGIFLSNLGENAKPAFDSGPNKRAFEEALGTSMLDEFRLYEEMERSSLDRSLSFLRRPAHVS